MQRESKARYPASSDVVMKMFTDKDFHSRKMAILGMDYDVLEHEFDGNEFRLKAQRGVPMNATGIAAKFMPAKTQVVNEESWSVADKSGAVVVKPQGVPLDMSCTAQMRDEDGECVITYYWDIRAKIPLGAGSLEKFVAADMTRREAEELEAAISLLDSYR